MKTAISIPDALFRRADAFAHRVGKSRSQLYREALAEYLSNRDPDSVTNQLDATIAAIGDDADDWAVEAGRQTLTGVEW